MGLSPEAQATIDAHKHRQGAYFRGEAPVVDSRLGARTIGDMALIGEGFSVWAKTDDDTADLAEVRVDYNGESRGGIVLEVTDDAHVDDETGEIVRARAFLCWNFYAQPADWRAWSTLTEAQVLVDSAAAPEMGLLRRSYRRFAADVGTRKGIASKTETDLMQYGARLAAIVAQTRGT